MFPYHLYTNLKLWRPISLLILILFTCVLSENAWNRKWVKWHGMADKTPKMRHRASLTFGQMRCMVRLTFGQMYLPKWFQWNAQKIFLKYIKLSNPKNSNKSILSDWEPSEIYICISFLYKCENLEVYISLNIDMFYIYLSRNAWNRLWVKWHGMADEPPGSDFGLGWHFVRWLVGWPFAAG